MIFSRKVQRIQCQNIPHNLVNKIQTLTLFFSSFIKKYRHLNFCSGLEEAKVKAEIIQSVYISPMRIVNQVVFMFFIDSYPL